MTITRTMSSPSSNGAVGRRRSGIKTYHHEEQALDDIAKEAESRLAQRRAARAEARSIRMVEMERQQREAEEKQDRHFELTSRTPAEIRTDLRATYASARRGSDDSAEDAREMRREIQELEEKYKKAAMTSAQLDNEKQSLRSSVDTLKDRLEELEEAHIELGREHRDRCREVEAKKRELKDVQTENKFMKEALNQRDKLIEEYGLVVVSTDTLGTEEEALDRVQRGESPGQVALVTPQALEILQRVDGSLDNRIKQFATERDALEEEIKRLKQALDDEKERSALAEKYSSPKSESRVNGPDIKQALESAQIDSQKQLAEYKYKLKKAEQEVTTLEGNVIRLESQVKRYKTAADNSEKQEDELKAEKRRLQRENRELQAKIEEQDSAIQHLQKRNDKLKSGRTAALMGN